MPGDFTGQLTEKVVSATLINPLVVNVAQMYFTLSNARGVLLCLMPDDCTLQKRKYLARKWLIFVCLFVMIQRRNWCIDFFHYAISTELRERTGLQSSKRHFGVIGQI